MNLLVGVSVFRVADLVRRCLDSLVESKASVLVIDNAADKDVKDLLKVYEGRIHVITNAENGYCNGGWNQIMQFGLEHGYDIVGLGSSDVTLHKGWYEAVCSRMCSFSDEVLLPRQGVPVYNPDISNIELVTSGTPGFFSFLPRKAVELVYPIPSAIRHWFGDQYMFEKLRACGWRITIMQDVRAYHEQSAITAVNPEAYKVIEQDIQAWKEMQ